MVYIRGCLKKYRIPCSQVTRGNVPSYFLLHITFMVISFCCEFLSFSISLRNLASFTGNPPNSDTTDPASKPTSSIKTRPNKSNDNRHRPSKML